jgi:hypothetical protein
MRRSVLRLAVLVTIACSIAPGSAYDSVTMQKYREAIRTEAFKREAQFRTYPNAAELRQKFDAMCGPIARDSTREQRQTFCASSCPNSHVEYEQRIARVYELALRKFGSNFQRDVKACLTQAIAADRDAESLGFSMILSMAPEAGQEMIGVIWTVTALGLGKGVPASRDAAMKVLMRVGTPDLPQVNTNNLMQLGIALSER